MFSGIRFLLVILLSTVEIGASKASALSPFIRHYEMLNYDLDSVHQQHSRAARSIGQPVVEITFSAHRRDFHLRLKRDTSVFLPSVTLVTANGEEVPDVSNFYSGELADEPGSYCHGSITEGLFQGKIHVGDDVFSVEPATNYMEDSESHSIIYEAKDVDYSSLGSSGCGMIDKIQKRMEKKMKEMEREDKTNKEADGSSYFSRHKRQAPIAQTCTLFIRTDIEFYERYGSRSAIIRQIGEHVQAATNIYSRTNFGNYQNINFAVSKIRIFSPDEINAADYPFKDPNLGVEKYLDYASNGDHSQYCLAYTFTNRDFANGVLGLAWIATDIAGSSGGLCSPKLSTRDSTLNTGIVTVNNYGSFVPPLVSHNTFAHEIGHSFGSNHDPMTNQVCVPGGVRGNYLMFAHASSGDLLNNDDFSRCSVIEMDSVLRSVFTGVSKKNCFVEQTSVTLCGNEVLEAGEMCDCGYEASCTDICCEPQNADNTNSGACQLKSPAVCSACPSLSICSPPYYAVLNKETAVIQQRANTDLRANLCKIEDECSLNATCTGNGFRCNTATFRPDHILCDLGRKICSNGECSRSVCEVSNLEECQCLEEIEKCEVCCQNIGMPQSCVATSRINIRGVDDKVLTLDHGSPCNNYMGYCDVFDVCRQVDEDGPLVRIFRNIFPSDESQLTIAIWNWIKTYWWVVVIIIIILIIIMFLVVFVCQSVIPTTNPWHKEREEVQRRSSINVKLQKKRNRGSRYYGQPLPPTSMAQHPDNAESRATAF